MRSRSPPGLLSAQARNPLPGGPQPLWEWFERAGFTENVFAENPDLDTLPVRTAMDHAADRLAGVPMCRSHLDYGLPNVFDGGVIDWQHHGLAPLGYDVYPMLEIVPFKGGTKGYRFTTGQRERYLAALDQTALKVTGRPLRGFISEFLLVKCFFFLALMRPRDATRPDKHTKWQYRSTRSRRDRAVWVVLAPSTPTPSPPSPRSPTEPPAPARAVRDRDYLLDRHGVDLQGHR